MCQNQSFRGQLLPTALRSTSGLLRERANAGRCLRERKQPVKSEPTTDDRLAIRERPSGLPLMHQAWAKLLFMHWPIKSNVLRPLLPEGLEIDTFEGSAWIAITPFTMWDIRGLPPFLPP